MDCGGTHGCTPRGIAFDAAQRGCTRTSKLSTTVTLAASVVGKLSDHIEPRNITGITLAIALLAFLLFWLIGHLLWGLIIGVILLDLGVQGTQLSNQTRIYSLSAELRSRLNTVYMVSYFIGGSLGSLIGAYAWSIARWNGVCFVGGLMLVMALVVYGMRSQR